VDKWPKPRNGETGGAGWVQASHDEVGAVDVGVRGVVQVTRAVLVDQVSGERVHLINVAEVRPGQKWGRSLGLRARVWQDVISILQTAVYSPST